MKTPPENLTPGQSLDIITSMIRQSQVNAQNYSFHFLLWGWVIVMANIGMYTLLALHYPYPYLVWTMALPAWIVSMVYGYRKGKARAVVTHIDSSLFWLWISFGVVVFTLVYFGYTINYQLNPLIIVVSAIPTLMTGVLLRFKPLKWGGITLWVLGIVCFLLPMHYQFLAGAVAVAGGYLIPGYQLKRQPVDHV